ncbi:MAG: hypothetical protein AAGG68_11935, partial [Bacteroidota bacterium]
LEEKEMEIYFDYQADTIVEENDPERLDLSKYQLFIDTTQNSRFRKRIKSWQPSEEYISSYLREINKDFQPAKIDLGTFPRRWISLEKLKDRFVIYDRCDGAIPRFEVRDTAFIFYTPHEGYAFSIAKLKQLTKNKFSVKVKGYPIKGNPTFSTLSIFPTKHRYIYRLEHSGETLLSGYYVTPFEYIDQFDILVNNCATMKRLEYDGFED